MTAIESDVLLAREGDEAAFSRLVSMSASTVCSIALAIVRNVAASEDVAQETFVAVWKGLRSLRNPASFLPWLRQVTRNQAHLWLREHGREIAGDDALAAAADSRLSPADAVLADEQQRLLGEVLDQLPDEAREVLVLYYREGSSTRQVSVLLGISEEAVRQRLSRSRTLVREEMLHRFGRTLAATAPGAAFASAVAGALTLAAPAASAAVAATSTGTSTALGASAAVAKATLIGSALGWFAVMMGMNHLEPVFDEREAHELRRFRNLLLVVVTAGSFLVALSVSSKWWTLAAVLTIYAIIIYLHAVKLPRILERRMEWERTVNPEMAKMHRRQWMWATISRAATAAASGIVLMSILFRWLKS